jgi:hypothetical protein
LVFAAGVRTVDLIDAVALAGVIGLSVPRRTAGWRNRSPELLAHARELVRIDRNGGPDEAESVAGPWSEPETRERDDDANHGIAQSR